MYGTAQSSDEENPVPNRLADSTSPYLLQHKDNPVDWWPWGEEAFEEARRRDVPILLSVGYAACHWCHVMAHQSFEDDATARLMNELTVPVKVDREERPDVDAVYMEATQAMTGQGGWPMTVFCTPDGTPFYCGTYFPREQFQRVVTAISAAWHEKRDAVFRQGAAVVDAIGGGSRLPAGTPLTGDVLDAGAKSLQEQFDPQHGGFGGAPKFPPAMALEFLLRHHHRTGDTASLEMVEKTAEAMARGGMYDQLAGGFARYAVDATWTVPHFEKMLYDNALLLRLYTNLWRATGSPFARRVADETATFLLTDLRTPEGGFASALDADTEGVEGLTYAWTPDQLLELLGPDDGWWTASLLDVTVGGTFEHGTSVLQLEVDPDDPARWAAIRERLLEVRRQRPQPQRDDKVVTSWNAVAITALAEYGERTGNRPAVDAAVEAAELIERVHMVGGRLRRSSRDGRVGDAAGVLDDHGNLAEAYTVLHQVTGAGRWLDRAGELLETVLGHFTDGSGGFFDTADDAESLVKRPQDPTDNASPSGNSATAGALVNYAALTDSVEHRDAAEAALAKVGALAARQARFVGWACAVGEALLSGPAEIAIVGDGPAAEELRRTAWASTAPGAVVVSGPPQSPGIPLLADRPLVAGVPAAYVCRGFTCDAPVTDPADLASALAGTRA
ncbi:MAG TPA: thioredoxin domain-containing protein [Mycobacteriales bacterium]|nr:thioredoxin domain-containing protein [Mycobacteriales bacterium]